jgi:Asp-tRNA(Asn)/Glu-tRNA(Gln) amidotransferase A subunit family amidase
VADPTELTATAAAAHIRAGELTSTRLVQACLDRIAARDPRLRAWAHLEPERALAEARARDAAEPSGALHGVPVGVKDIIDTADLPTEYGTPVYAGRRPDRDAAGVALLRAAGAVILGKTVTTELALFQPGPTRNPHDPERTPGGSSSGSAAAVADRHVPVALGTQTAGSIARPAAFCGIWGFKPTFGRLPTTGIKPVAPSLDTLGALARSAEDLALCAGVLAGDGRAWPVTEPSRIGFARTHEWEQAEAATRAALERLAADLALVAVVLPEPCAGLVEAQRRVMLREAALHLAAERREHEARLSPRLLEVLDEGATLTDRDRDDGLELARRCRAMLADVFADVDALVVPSVLGEAPQGLESTGDPLFCRAWTLLGTPTVEVPGLVGPAGLPLGVQVVAAPGRDDVALGAGRWLGQALASR